MGGRKLSHGTLVCLSPLGDERQGVSWGQLRLLVQPPREEPARGPGRVQGLNADRGPVVASSSEAPCVPPRLPSRVEVG